VPHPMVDQHRNPGVMAMNNALWSTRVSVKLFSARIAKPGKSEYAVQLKKLCAPLHKIRSVFSMNGWSAVRLGRRFVEVLKYKGVLSLQSLFKKPPVLPMRRRCAPPSMKSHVMKPHHLSASPCQTSNVQMLRNRFAQPLLKLHNPLSAFLLLMFNVPRSG